MVVINQLEDLLHSRPANWWDLLCEFIPELSLMEGTQQPAEYHAEGDVAIHTRLAIEACPNDCDPDLPWVALLHDIGKPATTKQYEDGRITAHGHARLGAEMTAEILTRLGMPEDRKDRITWVIHHHTFHHSWQLDNPDDLTSKQRKYLEDPRFPLLLQFLRVDSLASKGSPKGLQCYEFYQALWEHHSSRR